MIVPQYWAEARVQHCSNGKQITVRRFGWSDVSQEDAQIQAEARAQDALSRVSAGEDLARRERKAPYNGAEGVPIREEIVDRRGDTIVTRNSYGALCLNTPDVLFIDIDFTGKSARRQVFELAWVLALTAGLAAWLLRAGGPNIAVGVLALFGLAVIVFHLPKVVRAARGGAEGAARARIDAFLSSNPAWHLRLYRTPAGLRVLAMHDVFYPVDPVVAACFEALGTDPIHAKMCLNQRCFRARVSPKPWRIGMSEHIRPGHGTWPVRAEDVPLRKQWIDDNESRASRHASCRFVAALGSGVEHPAACAVKDWHDELCRATSELPIA